jgi:hypothetical protein
VLKSKGGERRFTAISTHNPCRSGLEGAAEWQLEELGFLEREVSGRKLNSDGYGLPFRCQKGRFTHGLKKNIMRLFGTSH